MEQLIKISKDGSGNEAVSARELFMFLELDRSQWARWARTNIENNQFAVEGLDWEGFDIMSNGNKIRDYTITIDFAKRISMMARTEKGEQARQYFLECERRAKNPVFNLSRLDMAKMLVEAEEEREKLQEQVKLNAPKVLFADSVAESSDSILIKELAAYLSQNGVLGMGQNRLFSWLREKGYLCSKGEYHNLPTQKAIELGLFEVKKTSINKPDGTILASTTTKVTGKGQIYFVNKFLNIKAVA